MQINDAIAIARMHTKRYQEAAAWFLRTHPSSTAAQRSLIEAKAIYDICDALEGFLARQEEDNSYHTK